MYSKRNKSDPDLDPVKFREWHPNLDRIPKRTGSTTRGLTLHRYGTTEESGEHCTVVFALFVTEPASECVCVSGGRGLQYPSPHPY
jgi:hypothetical protein